MAIDVHIRDLRYFVAVAEELSFSRAAGERLFISQPALSKQIRALEATLNVTLFDRDRRSITLTTAGEALLPRARALIADWNEAGEQLAAITASERERLKVGFQTRLCLQLRPAVDAVFKARRPGWQLEYQQVGWGDSSAGLLDGSSDVAILWLPAPEGLEWREICSEPRYVALPEGHPLAELDTIPFEALLDEPFLALPPSAGALRDYWLAADERGGAPIRITGEVATPDETFEAVAHGVGIVLLARGNAELYRPAGVACRPVSGLSPSRLAVAWRARDTRRAVKDFVVAARGASIPSLSRP